MQDHVTLCRALWEKKQAAEVLAEQLKKAMAEMESLKFQIIKELDARELTKQHIPGYGTIFVQTKHSVQTPKTAEEKQALFDYIRKEKGDDALLGFQTIHSATLNSFYDAEATLAAERGDFRWTLPGVGEPQDYKTIGMRKG